VPETIRERYSRWQLEQLLIQHPGLRIVPSSGDDLTVSGAIDFRLQGPHHEPIEDRYAVELKIPPSFPGELPVARETGGLIPSSFHKFKDGGLCLGAPTALRLRLAQSPTLLTYVDEFVVPYLFGYSYFVNHGVLPFGELAHGPKGILEYIAELFGATNIEQAYQFLHLASLKKRDANQHPCPCLSGRRLGRCHNHPVSDLRDRLGRRWFRAEYARVTGQQS
jgi:hypothetical protein